MVRTRLIIEVSLSIKLRFGQKIEKFSFLPQMGGFDGQEENSSYRSETFCSILYVIGE